MAQAKTGIARNRVLYLALVGMVLVRPVAAGEAASDNADEVKRFVSAWANAQNQGDFAAYEKLYDAHFTGVRRTGNKTVQLDRAGWMTDRQRMFRKKMSVQAESVTVTNGQKSGIKASFAQVWESGTFHDSGIKELLLVRRENQLKIIREELLHSHRGKATGTATEEAKPQLQGLDRIAFVVEDSILLPAEWQDAWVMGPPVAVNRGQKDKLIRAKQKVNEARLPADVKRWLGARVHLLDAHGAACAATITGFEVVALGPDFGADSVENFWDGTNRELVAHFKSDTKACEGATWARAAARPLTRFYPAENPSKELEVAALAAFHALPQYKKIQREYAKWQRRNDIRERSPWDQASQLSSVVVIHSNDPAVTLVSVSEHLLMNGGDEHCDLFSGNLWGLWEVQQAGGKPRLIPRNLPAGETFLDVEGAADIDGDGKLELLFRTLYQGSYQEELHQGVIYRAGDLYDDKTEGYNVGNLNPCPC